MQADVGVDRTSAPLAITDKRTGNGREVSTSLERTGPEGGLAGAERVLERDRFVGRIATPFEGAFTALIRWRAVCGAI